MKNLTLVRFSDDAEQFWNVISKDDVVDSFVNESLKVLSGDIIEKYSIKAGDRKDKFEDNEEFEEFENDLSDCEYADTFLEDYIRVDSISENEVYFDSYTDEFFSGDDVLSWDTDEYYWYHDGSNWQMREIAELKEVEAEFVGSENYSTGNTKLYRLKNGKEFKVDSSMYQGSIDNVLEEDSEVIEEA